MQEPEITLWQDRAETLSIAYAENNSGYPGLAKCGFAG